MSVINWLKTKPTPRFYWSNRAAYGVKQESKTPLEGSLGLLRFDDHRPTDSLWEPFGESRFIVPKKYQIESEPSPLTPLPMGEGDFVLAKSGEGWNQAVEYALTLIQKNQLQKVVLARQQILTSQKPINPILLFEKLRQIIPNAHHFYFEPEPNIAFLGASPEQLYKRIGNQIESEAQAGTRIRGHTVLEDNDLEQELLENSKDHHEHQLVVDHISQALSKLCLDYGITESKHVVKLPNVQHLKTRLAGILKNTVTDQDILEVLHPTAAVCGWPISQAFDLIRQLEKFDRGFYTGAFGFITKEQSEFNVALRGAVVSGCDLHLFAGAGIVAGSTAVDEWQEVDNKMAFWRKLV